MENGARCNTPAGDDQCGSGSLDSNRRIFMFQSPLSLAEFLRSASGSRCGVPPCTPIDWDDTADLSETATLPRISERPFSFVCHIGIMVIDNTDCANTNLTLEKKLLAGTIYEHSGPQMEQASHAIGRAVDSKFVKSLAAIEYIGHTTMEESNLNGLLQELVRADRALDRPPPYKPLFWNCHDIACRFAFLAATPDQNLHLLRELSGRFERAKFSSQRLLRAAAENAYNVSVEHVNGYVNSSLATTGSTAIYRAAAYTSPVMVIPIALKWLGTTAMTEAQTYSAVSRAISERTIWAETLDQRFPRLNLLNDVTRDEWNQLLETGLFGRLFKKVWG